MSDSEIQKEIENGGGGGGFDFSQPAALENTVAANPYSILAGPGGEGLGTPGSLRGG